jgi:SPP1 family phage portal protein
MKTYQDLLANKGSDLQEYVYTCITDYKGSEAYRNAVDGINYSTGQNTVIMAFKKLLYDMTGEAFPDNYTANHKCPANFLQRFATQEAGYLLSNGIQFQEEPTKEKLGEKIDSRLHKAAKDAIIQGAAYGFYNNGDVVYFSASEFCPLFDEETGQLKAGIRFWQIDPLKPLRATLYEEDGYTDYINKDGSISVLNPKRSYKYNVAESDFDGMQILDGENYPDFPIVPLYANTRHSSELIPIKSQIDAFDLIKSGFANDLDEASLIYWTLEGCGGMDDIDIAKFRDRMKVLKTAVVDGDQGSRATAHTIDVPYQSRETYLNRLEKDMIKDFMALDVEIISAGSVTATQIRAAYEPLNEKCDELEYCVIEHIQGLLRLAGVDDYPTFRRSQISNETETTQMIMQCANILDKQTILEHLPFLTVDEVPQILERLEQEEAERMPFIEDNSDDDEKQEENEDEKSN